MTGAAANVMRFSDFIRMPGNVTDDGGLWLPGGRQINYGQTSLTIAQAQVAEMFGWTILPDTEVLGRVIVTKAAPPSPQTGA